jgi:2-amino-4-hydroxy-6-hydroxymethyldihydropteridine diphosphokinase
MSQFTPNAFFCLGSNIHPSQNLQLASSVFKQGFAQLIFSNIYESPAVGFDGGNFLNMVVAIQTKQSMRELLAFADQLEQQAGRERQYRGAFDSRTLDVDLLLYNGRNGHYHGKDLPNEDILQYAHVLAPLQEVAGEVMHPDKRVSFAELWQDFEDATQKVWRSSVEIIV